MKSATSAFALLTALLAFSPGAPIGTASAETISVDGKVAIRDTTVAHPTRGMSMESVQAKFGEPTSRRAAVGQPPITRWDYPGFSVFFEHQFVIHAVVVGG